jgi:hypothetical protein
VIQRSQLSDPSGLEHSWSSILEIRDALLAPVFDEWVSRWHIDTVWVRRWVMPVIPPSWLLAHPSGWIASPFHWQSADRIPPWAPRSMETGWITSRQYSGTGVLVESPPESQYYVDVDEVTRAMLVPDAFRFESRLLEQWAPPPRLLNPDRLFTAWDPSNGRVDDPPNPLFETRENFLSRMRRSWRLRADQLQGTKPAKRKIEMHAQWFIRFQVNEEPIEKIWDPGTDDVDLSTIRKALESFSTLIDLPLRRAQPND